jgi:FolB domain-containing protein
VSDVIAIHDLVVDTRIGVTEEERAELRPVTVQIEIQLDLRPPGRSDDLDDTLDYAHVTSEVSRLLHGGEFRLLEHAAEQVADKVLANRGVRGVTVEVAKRPPIPEEVGSVAVRITRTV